LECFSRAINKVPRTMNSIEGFHRRFK